MVTGESGSKNKDASKTLMFGARANDSCATFRARLSSEFYTHSEILPISGKLEELLKRVVNGLARSSVNSNDRAGSSRWGLMVSVVDRSLEGEVLIPLKERGI